jgi:sugar phosphate isomerase/epimerase
MSYSLQLYTLRNAIQEDLPGTIRKVAEIGFTQVEPYNFVATAKELGEALRENGLTAPSGHAPLLSDDQDAIFRAAQQLGIGTVIDPHVPIERWNTVEDIKETAAHLNAAAAKGAGYGVRVGYHNHWWEVESVIDGKTALEHLADHAGPGGRPRIGHLLGWPSAARIPPNILARLGDRVKFIHIKDGPVTADPSSQLAVGDGKMPVWDVLAARQGPSRLA